MSTSHSQISTSLYHDVYPNSSPFMTRKEGKLRWVEKDENYIRGNPVQIDWDSFRHTPSSNLIFETAIEMKPLEMKDRLDEPLRFIKDKLPSVIRTPKEYTVVKRNDPRANPYISIANERQKRYLSLLQRLATKLPKVKAFLDAVSESGGSISVETYKQIIEDILRDQESLYHAYIAPYENDFNNGLLSDDRINYINTNLYNALRYRENLSENDLLAISYLLFKPDSRISSICEKRLRELYGKAMPNIDPEVQGFENIQPGGEAPEGYDQPNRGELKKSAGKPSPKIDFRNDENAAKHTWEQINTGRTAETHEDEEKSLPTFGGNGMDIDNGDKGDVKEEPTFDETIPNTTDQVNPPEKLEAMVVYNSLDAFANSLEISTSDDNGLRIAQLIKERDEIAKGTHIGPANVDAQRITQHRLAQYDSQINNLKQSVLDKFEANHMALYEASKNLKKHIDTLKEDVNTLMVDPSEDLEEQVEIQIEKLSKAYQAILTKLSSLRVIVLKFSPDSMPILADLDNDIRPAGRYLAGVRERLKISMQKRQEMEDKEEEIRRQEADLRSRNLIQPPVGIDPNKVEAWKIAQASIKHNMEQAKQLDEIQSGDVNVGSIEATIKILYDTVFETRRMVENFISGRIAGEGKPSRAFDEKADDVKRKMSGGIDDMINSLNGFNTGMGNIIVKYEGGDDIKIPLRNITKQLEMLKTQYKKKKLDSDGGVDEDRNVIDTIIDNINFLIKAVFRLNNRFSEQDRETLIINIRTLFAHIKRIDENISIIMYNFNQFASSINVRISEIEGSMAFVNEMKMNDAAGIPPSDESKQEPPAVPDSTPVQDQDGTSWAGDNHYDKKGNLIDDDKAKEIEPSKPKLDENIKADVIMGDPEHIEAIRRAKTRLEGRRSSIEDERVEEKEFTPDNLSFEYKDQILHMKNDQNVSPEEIVAFILSNKGLSNDERFVLFSTFEARRSQREDAMEKIIKEGTNRRKQDQALRAYLKRQEKVKQKRQISKMG